MYKSILCIAALSCTTACTTPFSSVSPSDKESSKADATSSGSKTNDIQESKNFSLPRADPPLFIDLSEKCALSQEGTSESPAALALIAAPLLKSLTATVVPVVAGWLYDKSATMIENHNAELLSSSTASRTTTYYNPDANASSFGCISIIRAVRGPAIDNDLYTATKNGPILLSSGSTWSVPATKKGLEERGIARVPEFYLEIALTSISGKVSPKMKTLNLGKKSGKESVSVSNPERVLYRKLKLARLYYLNTGAKRINNNEKHVSLELHLEKMSASGEWQPFFVKTYDFGKIKTKDQEINLQSLGEEIFTPPEARLTTDGFIDPVPMRIIAVLTETDDDTDLARTIETAIKSEQAKKNLVSPVANATVEQLNKKVDQLLGIVTSDDKNK